MKINLDFRIKIKTKRRISIHERKKDKNILWYKFFNEQLSENIWRYILILGWRLKEEFQYMKEKKIKIFFDINFSMNNYQKRYIMIMKNKRRISSIYERKKDKDILSLA